MKNLISALLVLPLLALSVLSCERTQENVQPRAGESTNAHFTARYAVPLTTGRNNGEKEIVDSLNAANKNVIQLKPAITKLVQSALAGEIPVHSDIPNDQNTDTKTFLQAAFDRHAANGHPVKDGELEMALEITFDGEAASGHSKLKPQSLDLIWVDSEEALPDKVMGRIYMNDLNTIKVKVGESEQSLPEYLETRNFENYVIHVITDTEEFGIRTFGDARTIQQRIDQGDIQNLNPHPIQ